MSDQQLPDERWKLRSLMLATLAILLLGGVGAGIATARWHQVEHTLALVKNIGLARAMTITPTARPLSSAVIQARKRVIVTRAAVRFMRRFEYGNYAAQWEQLAPAARAEWPGQAARTHMLTTKFGHASVRRVTVGRPVPDAVWVSHEHIGRSVRHVWRVPVGVRFVQPGQLQPSRVARAYGHLDLYLALQLGHRPMIVGEGPASIDAPILTPSQAPAIQANVPILMYHRVAPYPQRAAWTDDYGYGIEYDLTVPPAQFGQEMAYLAAHRYTAISLTRLADSLLYGLPLPAHPVVLTFDDGRRSPWVHAVPVLRRYGFSATFFVCAGFVGETNQTPDHLNVQHYLSWDQVHRLAGLGFWIEDHGRKDITPLWGLTPAQLQPRVGWSAWVLSQHTGQPVQFVAYTGALWPYPSASEVDPIETTLFANLATFGYVGGVTDSTVPSTLVSTDELWHLPRVRVFPDEQLASFGYSLDQGY